MAQLVSDSALPQSPPSWSLTVLFSTALFVSMHLASLFAIWTGVSLRDLLICVTLYVVRMFGVTAGYHRYFSHRTYKMGRVAQFFMALLATSSFQKGVLWWAANHRQHHRHSDQEQDLHSPRQKGFWWSHVGWILSLRYQYIDYSGVKDLARFPELRVLDKYHWIPGVLLGAAVFLIFGWSGLVVGFIWSTVLLWHGTFTINSLSHIFGKRRYNTTDDSRNNWFLALITLGEGWHNNHHFFCASTRQGFFWWEIDITYYVLKLFQWMHLVRDLKEPPAFIVHKAST